jgi:pimeloyl-ACP methyl ester carboxylesterase
MTTFVLVPGGCLGAAAWSAVTSILRADGHDVHPLTLTGLAERAHNATPETDLDTHITDVIAHLEAHDLADVELVGQSYAGAVVGGVAERAPERLARAVFVDALIPQDGVSLFDAGGPAFREAMVASTGGGWRIRFMTDEQLDTYWPGNGLTVEQRAWIRAHDTGHPIGTFEQAIAIGEPRVPRAFVNCTRSPVPAPGWDEVIALDSGHWPMFTAPGGLAAALTR